MDSKGYVLEASADEWISKVYLRAVRRVGPPSMTFSQSDAWTTAHRSVADRWCREMQRAMRSSNSAWQVRVVPRYANETFGVEQ